MSVVRRRRELTTSGVWRIIPSVGPPSEKKSGRELGGCEARGDVERLLPGLMKMKRPGWQRALH